ncbi:hypothetical protein KEJ47_05565 [Candidatus Bathyarchaeota archaeon]|nr:hypothetical protein [Candidatus Bathyarchaeota archaeon]
MSDLICCGAINWDINLFVDRLPRTGEEVKVKEIQRVSGGTAANVAVAAARILGPSRVSLIGSLGCDEIAEKQLQILISEGVDYSGILKIDGEESGQAYITISSNGENEIHTFFGANLKLAPERIEDRERLSLIFGSKIIVIMDPPLETAEKLAKISKENGKTVIWDPGVYSGYELKKLTPTIMNVDYFVLNNLEFQNLLGTNDPKEIIQSMSQVKRGIKVIIKEGDRGSTLLGDGGALTIHVDAVRLSKLGMEIVNTVGCGDAFIGAFAAAKVEELDDTEALRLGNVAGSFKATRKETRGGPTRAQLYELMARLSEVDK